VVEAEQYEPSLLDGAWLVIVVDVSQGERVFADASARNIFCNVEDVPERCTFILPALHRRGPITVAVSTSGASPALAQWLRDRFAAQIGFEHEQLALELRRIRPWVKQNFHTYAERREYFRERVRLHKLKVLQRNRIRIRRSHRSGFSHTRSATNPSSRRSSVATRRRARVRGCGIPRD
jgi:siroheme synthase-like protein